MTLVVKDGGRISVREVMRKYQQTVPTLHWRLNVLEVVQPRGEDKKPLVARFGGVELRGQKVAVINNRPPEVFNNLRSEIVRLTGQSGTGDLMNRSCKVREMRRAETTLIIIREKPE